MHKNFIHNFNKSIFPKVVLNIIIVFVLFVPLLSRAELPGDGGVRTGGGGSGTLVNPLKATSFSALINGILDIIIQFGTPLAALVLVYVGYTFVSSMGDTKKLTEAKDMLWWTIIGTALVVGAKAIFVVLQSTIGNIIG